MRSRFSKLFVFTSISLALLIMTPSFALGKDAFFDLFNKTDEKISKLRSYYPIERSSISDEELKAYYRKNSEFIDTLIIKYEAGQKAHNWLDGPYQTNVKLSNIIISDLYVYYNKKVLFGLIGSFNTALVGSIWIPSLLCVVEAIQAVEKVQKIYGEVNDMVVTEFLHEAISTLYAKKMADIQNYNYNSIFGPDGYYDQDLKPLIGDFLDDWAHNQGWTTDMEYRTLYDMVENYYIYMQDAPKQEIRDTILWHALHQGIYMPLNVTVANANSTVPQKTDAVITGSGFSKQGQAVADYEIYFGGSMISSARTYVIGDGLVHINIPTDCDTEIGEYVVKITDVDSLKSVTISYSVSPSIVCDFTPPQLSQSDPYNGEINVSVNKNSICFKFNEPMNGGYNIEILGIPDSIAPTSGTWTASDNICFPFQSTLPSSTQINWVLNYDTSSASQFTDLAGNALPRTIGSFTTRAESTNITIEGVATWNATMQNSYQYTVPEGQNRILVVTFSHSYSWFSGAMGGYSSYNSAQFYMNGIPMNVGAETLHGWNQQFGAGIFYFVNPPTGEVTISWDVSSDWVGLTGGFIAMTLFNCDTNNPIAGASVVFQQ